MKSEIDKLNKVAQDLVEGKTATPVTIRDFIYWFGAQRRTTSNVEYINRELEKVGVRTVPNYLNVWVDTPITFELVAEHAAPMPDTEININAGETSDQAGIAASSSAIESPDDPSYTIGKLVAANRPPISVKPNANLQEVVTLIVSRNYSQIPVMTTEREVKGIVSWTSIGIRSAAGLGGSEAQHFMDDHREISINASLFSALNIIFESNYVLVRANDKKISGIVTSNDISQHFEQISTPFLLLAEIENHLRRLIRKKLTVDDIRSSCKPEFLPDDFSSVDDLTFGNYVRIFEFPANWGKIGLRLDRLTFCNELSQLNSIRNEVMHLDPDPLKPENLTKLRDASRMFNLLRSLGAF